MKPDRTIQASLAVTAIFILYFFHKAMVLRSKAIFDVILAFILISIAWFYYDKIKLTPITAVFGEIFLIFHMLGALGWYDTYVWIVPYDAIMHYYGPLVLFVIIFNYLRVYEKETLRLFLLAGLATLGLNAIQEVVEFVGNSVLGGGEGMFFYGAGDFGEKNTEQDLVANFLGVLTGVAIMWFRKKFNR